MRRCAVLGCVKLYHLIPDFIDGKKSVKYSVPTVILVFYILLYSEGIKDNLLF